MPDIISATRAICRALSIYQGLVFSDHLLEPAALDAGYEPGPRRTRRGLLRRRVRGGQIVGPGTRYRHVHYIRSYNTPEHRSRRAKTLSDQ